MRKAIFPLLLAALPVMAQPVYSYKDSNGNTVYTNNQPPANVKAEEVRLPKTQIISPQKQINSDMTRVNGDISTSNTTISNITIQGIPSDEALRANNGTFTVTISAQANTSTLPSTYQYQLLLDGKPYGSTQSSNSFTLTNLDRGTHTLQAKMLNKGSVVASSATESFTVQRVHVPIK